MKMQALVVLVPREERAEERVLGMVRENVVLDGREINTCTLQFGFRIDEL